MLLWQRWWFVVAGERLEGAVGKLVPASFLGFELAHAYWRWLFKKFFFFLSVPERWKRRNVLVNSLWPKRFLNYRGNEDLSSDIYTGCFLSDRSSSTREPMLVTSHHVTTYRTRSSRCACWAVQGVKEPAARMWQNSVASALDYKKIGRRKSSRIFCAAFTVWNSICKT